MSRGHVPTEERGAAYISVILIIAVLFIWVAFQFEQLTINQQTVTYDYGIVQAQYLAESGIEQMRAALARDPEFDEDLTIHLDTGKAETDIVSRDPLRIRSTGLVAPDIRQTITVALDPTTLNITTWSRKKQ